MLSTRSFNRLTIVSCLSRLESVYVVLKFECLYVSKSMGYSGRSIILLNMQRAQSQRDHDLCCGLTYLAVS